MPRKRPVPVTGEKDTPISGRGVQTSVTRTVQSEHHIDLSQDKSLELLCEQCRGLDISLSYDTIAKYENGKVLADLDDMDALLLSSCPLCQFFALVSRTNGIIEAYQDFPDMNPSRLQLRAITIENLYLPDEEDDSILAGVRKQKQVVFCLVPLDNDELAITPGNDWLSIGVIAPESTHMPIGKSKKDKMFRARRVIPDRIPYELLTVWIDDCRRKHGEECAPRRFKDAPCLRVIDCKTLEIVESPQRCEYIALSYVWGSSQARGPGPVNDKARPGTLRMPEEMALVVTDAIQVVLQLGYRFLWIDKYCIDQENANEKASQIRDMGLIYASSIFVIVAAGGMDSSFGLPGVSHRSRNPQPSVNFGGRTWLSNVPHPTLAIRKSGWITRGWTFQEAIFSKRRLYFTEHQVAFECEDEGNVQIETLHIPRNVDIDEPWCPKRVFQPVLMESPIERGLDYIAPRIEEYSSRDLTCESDALHGFRSFYTQMERNDRPVYQFCGLPIMRQEEAGWDWPMSDHSDSDGDVTDSDDDGDVTDSDDDGGEDDSEDEGDDDDDDDDSSDDDSVDLHENSINKHWDADDHSDDTNLAPSSSAKSRTTGAEYDPLGSLMVALCWYHTSIADNVDDVPRRYPTVRRRHMFPSWSWLGWTGRVSYEESTDLYPDLSSKEEKAIDRNKQSEVENEIDIEVEDKQGALWPWRTWDDVEKICSLDTNGQLSGRLRVTGCFEMVDLSYVNDQAYVDRRGYKPEAELYISNERSSAQSSGLERSSMEIRRQHADKYWRFLSLGQAMMLVTEVREGEYSRLGVTIPVKRKKEASFSKQDHAKRTPVQVWLV